MRRLSDYRVLYGQEMTQEELRAERERGDVFLFSLSEDDGELRQHWSVGWRHHRDGRRGYFEDDWYACDSWSCERIVCPSYSQQHCIRLALSVQGKRGKNGKLRAHRWAARLVLGDPNPIGYGKFTEQLVIHGTLRWGDNHLPIGRCKSVSDAMRQADQLDLGPAIEKLLTRAYSPRGATCLWRREGERWEPYLTILPVTSFSMMSLPRGEYATTKWDIGRRDDGYRVHVSHIKRGPWGYSGTVYGSKSDEPEAMTIQALGVWYPVEEEAA